MRPPADPLQATLTTHLRDNAVRYFGDLAGKPVRVALLRSKVRPHAALYRFELSADNVRHRVLAKSATGVDRAPARVPPDAPPDSGRPRIWALTATHTRNPLEYATMMAIHEHFSDLGDPRFGTIRVLELLPDDGAILMEESADRSLRSLFVRGTLRPGFRPAALEPAFRNAGAWLHAYHRLSTIGHATDRRESREEFVESVREFASYLAGARGNASFFESLVAQIESAAHDNLPLNLPLGMAHADFALRNVLVGPKGAVSVIDTAGRWRVPIYHDIASFLISLDVIAPRACSQGLLINAACIRRFQQAFLRGYFPDAPAPLASIRLFEIESLLDKWTSTVHRYRRARRPSRFIRRCDLEVRSRFFARRLEALMSG